MCGVTLIKSTDMLGEYMRNTRVTAREITMLIIILENDKTKNKCSENDNAKTRWMSEVIREDRIKNEWVKWVV